MIIHRGSDTLGLVGDGDDLDLLVDLETAFGIGITNFEAERCRTVGDIYALLGSRFRTAQSNTDRCATAMAFYRIRRALKELGTKNQLSPGSPIAGVSGLKPKQLFKRISNHTGLRLPTASGPLGSIGFYILTFSLAVWLAIAVRPGLWLLAAAVSFVGASLIYWDSGRLPTGCRTIGDLTKKVAGRNLGRLVIEGARPRDKDLWRSLIEILADHSSLAPAEIRPETRILAEN